MFRDVPSIQGYSDILNLAAHSTIKITLIHDLELSPRKSEIKVKTVPSFPHLGDLQWTIFHFQWWIKGRWEEALQRRHTFCAKIQLLRRSQNAWSVKTNMGGSSSKAKSKFFVCVIPTDLGCSRKILGLGLTCLVAKYTFRRFATVILHPLFKISSLTIEARVVIPPIS